MSPMSPDAFGAKLVVALATYQAMDPRSLQKELGISSIGHCRSEALFRLMGTDPTDMPSMRKALNGTALHEKYDQAMEWYDPTVITRRRLVVTLPSGMQVPGTPDWIFPAEPAVVDLKSVDDAAALHLLRRTGSSEQQQFQRHLYYLAAHQAGLVPAEGLVRNIWVDRAGQSEDPYVEQEPFSMDVVHAADSWLQDLVYAQEHGEEVPRDKHYDFCVRFCPFVTRCRTEAHGDAVVTDAEMVQAAAALYEGRDQSHSGDMLEKAAKQVLAPLQDSVSGDLRAFILGDYRLRWTAVHRDGGSHWKANIDRVAP